MLQSHSSNILHMVVQRSKLPSKFILMQKKLIEIFNLFFVFIRVWLWVGEGNTPSGVNRSITRTIRWRCAWQKIAGGTTSQSSWISRTQSFSCCGKSMITSAFSMSSIMAICPYLFGSELNLLPVSIQFFYL